MTSYVALLRGVNLLGVSTLRMTDLQTIAKELGLGSPRTFIASGNLLFKSDKSETEVKRLLEERLTAHMGRKVVAIVRTAAAMADAARANPFPDAPANTVQAFFMDEPPPENLLDTVRNRAADERIAAGAREVYVAYGERGIGRSRLRIPAAEAGTARNMNTVAKLAELAKEAG
ncbi:MAG TPA: DUF1697 domain-containing protein [Sphingomicrobium sp.]|nr:DUF1697 domain-containing protein [Sphingomicrobium sp.]